MKRSIGLFILALLLNVPAWAAQNGTALERPYRGIVLKAIQADPDKTFDTDLVPAEQGLQNLASALDLLLDKSPFSAAKLEILKKSGKVYLVYLPGDLSKGPSGEESVAVFRPDFLRDPNTRGREKIFLAIVGRHGIKWPAEELAAVIAHELVGHGIQHQRGRLTKIRGLDVECEALLYHEIANQDLGLDKLQREMVQFRQMMEESFCTDFKTYMRAQRPDAMALWDVLNPDVPKLLKVFEAYLAFSVREGVTAKSLAAAQKQLKERRQRALKDATPDELVRVALALRDGALGVRQNFAEARRYFKIAAEQGHPDAQFQLARLYEIGQGVPRDFAEAVKWYAKAAEQDHTVAQYNLGVMYNDGQGVARDDKAAAKWYRKAAQKGYPDAQNNLGWLYEKGQGVSQDYTEAVIWYAKAAEQGAANANAQYNLGRLYAKGRGVPQDYATAATWYRLAAAQGQAWAQYRLGWLYAKGRGVEKDAKQAVALYRKSANAGIAAAQNRLGWLRLKGKGVKKDYAKAARWLKAAAKQEYTVAYYHLATMNRRGLGRAKDHAAAARLYAKAANRGHVRSQYRLGWYLYRGIGVAKDISQAAAWIGKAAAAGHAKSQHSLGWMYAKGNGVKRNPATALAWFRKAAEQGYADAQARLGLLYRKGIGAKQDKIEAYMWYSLAASNAKAAAKARKDARKYQDLLAKTMSPAQISKAKRRVKDFRAK